MVLKLKLVAIPKLLLNTLRLILSSSEHFTIIIAIKTAVIIICIKTTIIIIYINTNTVTTKIIIIVIVVIVIVMTKIIPETQIISFTV